MKTDGGPAFPTTWLSEDKSRVIHVDCGMTLRDYFAAKFLQGLIASNPDTNMASKDAIQITVKACYMMADAMLKERLK